MILTLFFNYLISSLDKKNRNVQLILFDILNLRILINQLKSILQDNTILLYILTCFVNFLTERPFSVKITSALTKIRSTKYEVPQDSYF